MKIINLTEQRYYHDDHDIDVIEAALNALVYLVLIAVAMACL